MHLSFGDVDISGSDPAFKSVHIMFKCYYSSYEVLHSFIIL